MLYFKQQFVFIFSLCTLLSQAQEGTRNTTSKPKEISGKIMLVPFEPKLYMSEIDLKINQKTKWNFEQIRENFRHQVDAQLKLKCQSSGSVVSFYTDSAKMSKDLEYIYKSTSIFYDLLDKPSSSAPANTNKSGIKNGQVAVEISEDKKFMNTKITNAELLGYLNKKYKSEYFIFVNELDIKNDPGSYDVATDTYQRDLVIHYAILDKSGKTIACGVSSSRFSSQINEPKKIVALYIAPAANIIAGKLSASLAATEPLKK